MFKIGGFSKYQIRGMLRLKEVELHQQLEEGQARLARIEAWLQASAWQGMVN